MTPHILPSRRAAIVLAAAIAAPAAAPGISRAEAVTSAPYRRAVEVLAPGWVRVPLPAGLLARTVPDESDLRVLGPDDAEVPFQPLSPELSGPEWSPVAIDAVEAVSTGWRIIVDTGESGRPHQGLSVDFTNPDTTPRVQVATGAGDADWVAVADTTLFRLGPSAGLTATDIGYPATRQRYLRLLWPSASGVPRLRSVAVLRVPPDTSGRAPGAVELVAAPLTAAGQGSASFELHLPGRRLGPGRIEVALAGAGAVGYRLLAPADGLWEPLAEGVFVRHSDGERLALQLARPILASSLRMDLHAGGNADVRIESARALFDAREVVFHAEAPGTYSLAYGCVGCATPVYPAVGQQEEWASLPAAEVGPERLLGTGDGLLSTAQLGGPIPPADVTGAWSVGAAAAPGDLVRLTIPEYVYAAAGGADTAALRLAVDERQIPYVAQAEAAPVAAVSVRGARPEPGREPGVSVVEIEFPGEDLPLVALDISAPAAPFRRTVSATWIADGWEDVDAAAHYPVEWSCGGFSALPCTLAMRLGPNPTRRLELAVHDGDDGPLPSVDVVAWRRSDALYFVWPATGNGAPTLLAMAGLRAPTYDLALVGEQIVQLPHRTARLAGAGPQPDLSPAPPSDALLIGAVSLAAVAMLGILASILRALPREAGEAPPTAPERTRQNASGRAGPDAWGRRQPRRARSKE